MMEAPWGSEPFQPLADSLAGGLAQITGPTAGRGGYETPDERAGLSHVF